MFSEGVVTSIDAGLELLAQDPEVAAPAPGGSSGPSAGAGSGSGKSDDKVAIKDHPQYSKYFKMLKVGLPIDAVKAKMQQEGINSDYIDKVKSQPPSDLFKSSYLFILMTLYTYSILCDAVYFYPNIIGMECCFYSIICYDNAELILAFETLSKCFCSILVS